MEAFLAATKYVDYNDEAIQQKAKELFFDCMSDVEKAEIAYKFVRDNIIHSFDCGAEVITARASEVLKAGTGICHAKANLLAALLRSQGIPAGFCFEHITLADDESLGYCVHAYNAVWLDGRWIRLDARGSTNGTNAQFSLGEPVLAYPPREQYDEYFFNGIYSRPHQESMDMLEKAESLQDIIDNIPEYITDAPDEEFDYYGK